MNKLIECNLNTYRETHHDGKIPEGFGVFLSIE